MSTNNLLVVTTLSRLSIAFSLLTTCVQTCIASHGFESVKICRSHVRMISCCTLRYKDLFALIHCEIKPGNDVAKFEISSLSIFAQRRQDY